MSVRLPPPHARRRPDSPQSGVARVAARDLDGRGARAADESDRGGGATFRRVARGSSPPPVPDDARAAAALEPASGKADDTEYAPPPVHFDDSRGSGSHDRDEDPTVAASSAGYPAHDPAQVALRRGRATRVPRPGVIPRRGGVTGDLRYVLSALAGVVKARKGLAHARREVARERAARDGELMALARRVVAAWDMDVPVITGARDELSRIEERRAERAGRVAAAEESLAAIERQRVAELDALRGRRFRLDAKIASVRERLGTLSRRGATALRRAGQLEASRRSLDRSAAFEERKLMWVRRPNLAARVEAKLRDRRAQLEAIHREQHEIATELDSVEPAIASLQSKRADLAEKYEVVERDEQELELRTAERIEAVRATRRVDERAVASADRERDKKLRDLAERLTVERPAELSTELSRLDERELAIAKHERRVFEYSELMTGLDRRALARGALVLLALAGAVVGIGLLLS